MATTKSAISFGLVHIPISLHTATQDNGKILMEVVGSNEVTRCFT